MPVQSYGRMHHASSTRSKKLLQVRRYVRQVSKQDFLQARFYSNTPRF